MSTEKFLTYRGDIKSALGFEGTLAFVTVHAEGQPTGLNFLDVDKFVLSAHSLPAGGVALVRDQDTLWVAGSDGRIYECPTRTGKPVARGTSLPGLSRLALLAGDRLAALAGQQLSILARKDGRVLQSFELPEPGSCLAADPGGKWLAVGTAKGTVQVYSGEEGPEFILSESAKLHEGTVSALLFEPEELRFLSAGADLKLLSTHARGKLEPEDRGRGNMHSDVVTALIWGPGDRFYSGSRDGTIKTWPRQGAGRPATQKDGVGRVVDLALVQIHNRSHLVAACDDNTLRFFLLDAAGKFGDASHKIHGALAWARHELAENESRRREPAIQALAEFNDTASIELLAEQVNADGDHALRLLAARLLGESSHPRAAKLLEKCLTHGDEPVRVAAFHGLRRHLGEQDLRPLDLALKAEKPDVGKLAVQALEELAARDDQALARLNEAINARTLEVRQAALSSLEKVHNPQSPDSNLRALESTHADLRRLTLIRLFQRQMLEHGKVQAALRWRGEDRDADVRRTAFLVSLCTRPRLVQALRTRDADLDRQLIEVETFGQEPAKEARKEKKPAKVAREPKTDLDEADYEPLLQATASRALDTCLRGARGLAVLGDARAFGLLLQLSREESTQARVDVCRALAALDDPRSVNRLRSLLYDEQPEVRDAAFTALERIHNADPLLAAEAGLSAAFEDVRRRGLQTLIAEVRKKKPKQADAPGWALLVRALNDSFESVRGEAFKACLNLEIGGGGIGTLRFVLQSIHADVRREVLTEVMAQVSEAWAWNLLLEFCNDHEPRLRDEAFQFATKKNKELEPLEKGLLSFFADVRKQAVEGLIKKHSKAAQALLARALADADRDVRLRALESLVDADARQPLVQALTSPHEDVRVRAAAAVARHGDQAALAPLLQLATAAEPEHKERRQDWGNLVNAALDGLGELGDSTALAQVRAVLDSRFASIRKHAAAALAWLALPHHVETLRQLLQHSDNEVKYRAALGLAYAGDPMAAPLVFSSEAGQVLTADERLAASFALGPAGEDQLIVLLDEDDEWLRTRAQLLLFLRELKSHQGTPMRCLACLSSRMPRVRLTAARALEAFAEQETFAHFVVHQMNDRSDEQPWTIPAATVDTLAELLVHGSPGVRARSVNLLRHLTEEKQASWDQAWAVHEERFAAEIKALVEGARQRPAPARELTLAQLRQMAFGAYVGLVREQGGVTGRSLGQQVVRVRQTALDRILELGRTDDGHGRAARPVLVQALGDPNGTVREKAFDHLQTLGMDKALLGAEALETGHKDLGIRGLQLLSGGAGDKQGQAVLDQVLQSRNDSLAIEAANLLAPQRGWVALGTQALAAVHEPLRLLGVAWLEREYDKDDVARNQLRQALNSRYQKVREGAALALATKKDAAAFDALVALLGSAPDANRQRQAIRALVTLGDARAPTAFLDRLDNDPGGTALAEDLFRAVGEYRRTEIADRLFEMLDRRPKWRSEAFNALCLISGHDQPIEDPEDENPDRTWETKQHPRRDTILARLIERCFTLGEPRLLGRILPAARWARGPEVGPPLALWTAHADDDLRRRVVEALGWRLRKRQDSADPLVRLLGHKDALTQFLAAEGLARAGRPMGQNVLLAAVEYMSDLDCRRRAVRALGELGDARALDLLLKLANEAGHALQDEAAEALGHLGQSEKRDEIFRLLERHARGEGSVAVNALKGLRWLNTREGWQLLRKQAESGGRDVRATAVKLLGYDDDPATRDLLLRLVATDGEWETVQVALTSARRLFGTEALEPDYAVLQSEAARNEFEQVQALERVCKRGEARRLLELLGKTTDEAYQTLATNLVMRLPPPFAEALAAVASTEERTVRVAAQLLGRAGPQKESGPALQAALKHWLQEWELRRDQMLRDGSEDSRLTERLTPCVESLLWATGRLGVGLDVVLAAVTARSDDPLYRPVRLQALAALAKGKPSKAALAALESVAVGNDPEARTLATEALARHDARRATALAGQLLSDRVSFRRLALRPDVDLSAPVRDAVGQLHYQGVALPHLISSGDVDGLSAVAENRKLPEATRLGAIEGLAALARETAEAKLVQLGRTEGDEEELRKAAWRALRRSKRARRNAPVAKGVKA